MKKEDLASLIVYLGMIALALILGFTVIKDMFTAYNQCSVKPFSSNIGFAIVVILIGLLINVVALELCHLLGGKVGGYEIISFNVFGFCWAKDTTNKFKFKFKDYDGLTGETKFAPKNEKCNPKFAVWFPVLFYLIELIICVVLYALGSSAKAKGDYSNALIWVGTGAIIFIALSSMIAIYNFVPVKLDSMTDGYRLRLFASSVNVEAYNELLRIENQQRLGLPVGEVKMFTEITDFTANINLFNVYDCLAEAKFEKAEEMIDSILNQKNEHVSDTTINRLTAQKIYIKLMTLDMDGAKKYYDENVNDQMRRFIANDLSMESIRAYILIAGLLDNSQGEVQYANSRKNKAMKSALKTRADIEDKLYKEALEKVLAQHTDWNMSKGA